MLTPATRLALARSGASPALRVAARRTPFPRARFASTTEQAAAAVKASEGSVFSTVGSSVGGSSSSSSSHFAAGVAGGLSVLLVGYTAYQFSDAKKAVDAASKTAAYAQQAKDKIADSVQATIKEGNPSAALAYLRKVAQSYVAAIPGAGPYVDATFDSFDKLAETHGPEVEKISKGAYDEIQKVYKDAKAKGTVDAAVALTVADILRRRLAELYELGKRAGEDALGEVLEKNPEVKEKLGGAYKQLQALAKDKGPEAKKLLEDTQREVKELFAKGFSPDALVRARQILQQKADEARKLAEPAARAAWDKALDQARPALDKLPEVKQYLDSNSAALVSASIGVLGGSSGSVDEIVKKVKEVANMKESERKEKAEELKKWLEGKVQDAKSQTAGVLGLKWEDVQGYVKMVPGGDELLDKVPNARALLELSADRGEDAARLARETWEDVLRVLEEKGRKAKELAEDTAEDAKGHAKGAKDEAKDKAGEAKDKAGKKAEEVKQKAGDKAEEAKDKAGEAKDKAGKKVDEAKDKAGKKAEEVKDKAKEKK